MENTENGNQKLDYIYVWLSQIYEVNYIMYLRLLKYFESLEKLYVSSKNKSEFETFLIQNNIILSNKLIQKLTDFNLKKYSLVIYNNLINQNIKIISIENILYPHDKFNNWYNKPLCLYIFGNMHMLNGKNVYLHHEHFDKYGKKVYDDLKKYIDKKDWNLVTNIEFLYSNENIKKLGKVEENTNNIYVCRENIFSEKFKVENFEYLNLSQNEQNLVIFLPKCLSDNKINVNTNINTNTNSEIISSLSDICIIPQAKYNKDIYVKIIVELFLEKGKSILVVPGNIYSKYNYLSNHLIKEGAEIILKETDIDKYLDI